MWPDEMGVGWLASCGYHRFHMKYTVIFLIAGRLYICSCSATVPVPVCILLDDV